MPDNLASTRVRVSQGVLASDLFCRAQEHPSTATHKSYLSAGPGTRNPVEVAQREYVAGKGTEQSCTSDAESSVNNHCDFHGKQFTLNR